MTAPASGSPSARAPAPPRSFHARRGRLSPLLVDSLDRLGPAYGVAIPAQRPYPPLDLADLGCGARPWVLEIGSGMGETTVAMAQADPATAILAVDVHTRGVARLMLALEEGGIHHVRVARGDAVVLLEHMLGPASLAGIRIFFPDPWPKARHHKRRLVQPGFVHLAATRLAPRGQLHLATDWQDYADQMLAAVSAEPLLTNSFGGPAPRPAWRPLTRYEAAGLAQGHPVTDLLLERVDDPAAAAP